jgi:uncharacterized C2H2 Zn-finger protein
MARPRRSIAKTTAAQTTAPTTGELTCPECGKTFHRAASLGAHRNRAHGVAGTSKPPRKTSGRRRASTATTSRRTRTASASASHDGAGRGVDRDALLQQLFPNGLPAREVVIRAANDWLDQAEQLAKLK